MKPEPQTTPSFPPQPTQPDDARARLSALADGDVTDANEVERACAGWREDAELRRTWHCYQLIGDVMRSDELAGPAARDAAFMAGLRERLAAEPVVLAPEPLPAAPVRRRQAWLMPAAAVAGFVVVAGVLVVTRMSQPGLEAGPGFATAPAGVMPVSSGANGVNRTVAVPAPGGDTLLRDERLDEYLRAHQFARGGAALSAPSTAVRRVELTVPATPER
jgi:sigma-E factor negative regulatory protein RseA